VKDAISGEKVIIPVQVNPSPVYPGRQVHVKLPGVLVQVAAGLQPPFFRAHSSTSVPYVITAHRACMK